MYIPKIQQDWCYQIQMYNFVEIIHVHIMIECIFLSERQYYVTFHPLGTLRYHWSLIFTFLFTWKVAGDLKFKLKSGFDIGFEFKFETQHTWNVNDVTGNDSSNFNLQPLRGHFR